MKPLRVLAALLAALLLWLSPSLAPAGNGDEGTGGGSGSGSGAGGPNSDGSGGGGSSGGGSSGGGGGSSGDGGGVLPPAGTSVPRVMLTEFITEPGQVVAGDAVTVSFTLQNMSTTTRVRNLLITLSSADAGAFLPVNGSSSTYISSIRPERSVTRTMTLRSLPTLEDRPYALTLEVEYEDAAFNSFQSSEQVAIPVTQVMRADTSAPQALPEEIVVGQQSTVMFSVNNLGRSKLFNTRAVIPAGQPVEPQEAFIGNIDPGASGSVDLTVLATEPAEEPIAVQITFEDATGAVSTMERTVPLSVVEEVIIEEPFPGEEFPMEPETGVSPVALLGLLAAVAVALAIITALVVRGRRRRRARAKDDDLALLDGDPLVPTDQR